MARSVTLVSIEYSELGQNLRATWKYISDLLKMWLIYQIGTIVFVLACMKLHEDLGLQADQFSKYIVALCVFTLLAIILCLGAAGQNSRLFGSVEAFVLRANYLEASEGFIDLDPSAPKVPLSQYGYMRQELYQPDKWNLSKVLSGIYAFTAVVWVVFALYVLWPRLSPFWPGSAA